MHFGRVASLSPEEFPAKSRSSLGSRHGVRSVKLLAAFVRRVLRTREDRKGARDCTWVLCAEERRLRSSPISGSARQRLIRTSLHDPTRPCASSAFHSGLDLRSTYPSPKPTVSEACG